MYLHRCTYNHYDAKPLFVKSGSGFFRLLAEVGDHGMKMQLVKMELGLTPCPLCHPDHTMLFPAETMPERKKPPESLGQLSGGKSYASVFYTGT